jgi:hypothetical protein
MVADRPGEGDEGQLARDMIDVHGAAAAGIARENARSAALAGQMARARRWLKTVGLIQQQAAASAQTLAAASLEAGRK